MKRIIYVDYENVNIGGLDAIERLTSDDFVKIFIGAQSSKLSMVDADRIFNSEAQVELITNKYIGKNALDFIIMVHLGYDIAHELGKEYYIVSKDKGYDPAIQEMRRVSSMTVLRRQDINEVVGQKKSVFKKALGFIGIGKEKEEKDRTEHHVIKERKKNAKPISENLVKNEEETANKQDNKQSRNHKNRNNQRGKQHIHKENPSVNNISAAEENTTPKENVPNEEKPKKQRNNVKKMRPDNKANAQDKLQIKEQSPENVVDKDDVIKSMDEAAKKNNRRRKSHKRGQNVGENIDIKPEEKISENTTKAIVEEAKLGDNENTTKTSYNNGRRRNRRPKEKFDEAKEVIKPEVSMANTEKHNQEATPEADKKEVKSSNYNRNRNRRNGRKPRNDNGSTVVEQNVDMAAKEPVLTPEQEARNRERAAAFALLEELNNE